MCVMMTQGTTIIICKLYDIAVDANNDRAGFIINELMFYTNSLSFITLHLFQIERRGLSFVTKNRFLNRKSCKSVTFYQLFKNVFHVMYTICKCIRIETQRRRGINGEALRDSVLE